MMIQYLFELVGLERVKDEQPVKLPYNFLSDKEIWDALSHLAPAAKLEVMLKLFGKNGHEHIPHNN